MTSWYIFFGTLSSILAFLAYVPYIWDTICGKTRPSVVAWLVWTLASAVVCISQIAGGGGSGAWATGLSGIICGGILGLALFQKNYRNTSKLDWCMLALWIMALTAYTLVGKPVIAVVLATIVSITGYVAVAYKSYNQPHTETMSMYFLSATVNITSLLALQQMHFVTAAYPISILVANIGLIALLLIRRRQLASSAA